MRGFGVIGIALCLSITAVAQTTADDLFQAIRNNDVAALKAPLAQGADVNSRDKRDNTLLMQAVAFGSLEAVKLLLGAGL
jgi:ankyrin repeat protein